MLVDLKPYTGAMYRGMPITAALSGGVSVWSAGGSPGVAAPAFTTQPTATPANAEVGQTVNLSLGIASNSTSLTGRLMQGGIVLRNSGGTLQAIYNDGTARTNTLGNVVYGQTFTIGIEIDNDAGRVRFPTRCARTATCLRRKTPARPHSPLK